MDHPVTGKEEPGIVQLLLLSNSTNHASTPLAHARQAITDVLDGRRLVFVPYALADHDAYTAVIAEALDGVAEVTGLHTADDPVAMINTAEAVYVGGGNTFRLLLTLQRLGLVHPLRSRVVDGMPYLGASAGTNLTCPTIRTTNDMPIVEPESFEALGLVPFQINPHYVDPAPGSTHMGETRQKRIAEFHEENGVPVLGIREGAWLHRVDDRLTLRSGTARLFRAGAEPQEFAADADLSGLLAG